ncbi:L-type lectin-domain containing receptor kinase IX.1-like [Syzygium oleosum]|uniref:L-type lectin-domain containing receptor kinase IX.1-like n=1 Tax=Syzygium oleosum TaxID=219896 RepID=UPI0024B954B7|nr:L-type lectin-domain containing receptor kinase IX.1-like [Syzygium oleosum]
MANLLCLVIQFLVFFLLLIGRAHSVSFNFSGFQPNTGNLTFEGDAFTSDGVIQLTRNQQDRTLERSAGRASYDKPVRLWDSKTGRLADFMAHFTFLMKALNDTYYGDGITFYIAPFDAVIPANSSGGYLALFNQSTANDTSANCVVAIEFDSFQNEWDPSPDHVGINVNSIVSVTNVSWRTSIKNGSIANAWVSYNSTSFNLSVFLTYANDPVFSNNSSLSYIVDLRKILPEQVRIGFSAATGYYVEIHNILSWSFSSTLEDGKKKRSPGLVLGILLGSCLVACVLGIGWFFFWRKKSRRSKGVSTVDISIDGEFEKGAGPKRFTYRDLAHATNDFAEKGKLGEGGFGGVYKGLLSESNTEIAVKRVSRGSKQGKKEYVSEVKIISRLRHRNLVQLIGWCHEQGELLLVYEFLPNGSLDSHLFEGKTHLTWAARYKIALGLASALLYLHEEWEQCVVHRDVKSSNVMLDSNFNAKLGDFGLARLVDHNMGSQTTVLAGTMGYLAPECVTTGKASKESDVYSFGVVALEIACGRKPVEPRAEPSKVRLVEWVWDLYGRNQVIEAADPGLNMEFDERQMECLMVVGLWCCHPDYTLRPPIKQVINVLNFEAPLPSLPSKLPVPMYYAPPMDMLRFSYTSLGLTDLDRTQSSHTSDSTYSSTQTGGSGKALLNSNTAD